MATDLGKAYVQIVPSAKNISGSITKALKGESVSAGESSGQTIGQRLVSGIKSAIAGAGIGLFIKKAISEGAKLEQSIGGIETMFKDSSETMIKYANEAWKTAGVSANTYMENVTSFSASLLQGLGGDTEAAAKIANQAMIDMSDNANKFGTDITSIQNAYQGFAKQNYTMLDNLKLGYGGTKTEMQRLIKDASKMKDIQKELGITVDGTSMSFDNIAKAITVVQKNMGIAGTTTLEAMTTVSGSLGAMKASYENLMSSLALGENVGESLNALISSAGTYAKNVAGMVANIANELPGALLSAFDQLTATGSDMMIKLVNGVKSNLPALIESFSSAIPEIVASIASRTQTLFYQGLLLVKNIVNGVVSGLPDLVTASTEIVSTLLDTMATMFSQFVRIGSDILSKIGEGLQTGIPMFLNNVLPIILGFTAKIRETLPTLISSGMDMILGLVQGLMAGLPSLISYVPQIISNIAGLINDNIPTILSKGWEIIEALGQGIIEAVPVIIANMGNIVQAILDVVQAINWIQLGSTVIELIGKGINALFNMLPNLVQNIGNTAHNFFKNINWVGLGQTVIGFIRNGINALFHAIPNILKSIGSTGLELFKSINWTGLGQTIINFIKNGISALFSSIPNVLKNIGSSAMSAFKGLNWGGIGSAVVSGIASGISAGASAVISAAVGVAKSAWSAAKSFLGIHSPSRLFRELGEMTDAGLALGISENVDMVTDAMDDITQSLVDSYTPDLSLGYGVNGGVSRSTPIGGYNQQINIYSPKNVNPSETARLTRNATRQMALKLSMGG